MKKGSIYTLLIVLIAALFLLYIFLPRIIIFADAQKNTPIKAFSTIQVGQEYAHNRDGYMLKVTDHIAVMKLYNEPDEVIWINNPEDDGMNGELILKADLIDYNQELYGLSILTDNSGQQDYYELYIYDSYQPEINKSYLLVKIDHSMK